MASSKWKTWEELASIVRSRRIVFWAASNWVERTIDVLPIDAAYVVDNNPNNHGIEYVGLPVYPPKKLLEDQHLETFVIVCTGNYPSVIDELNDMGFVMGDDYCISPLMNERQKKDDLKNLDAEVLVSSNQHFFADNAGGGLYRCSTLAGSFEKVFTGKCRGLSQYGDNVLVVDMLRGLVILDREFNEVAVIELQPNCEAHGVHFDAATNCAYVGQPGRDSIATYSMEDRRLVKEIHLSDKWQRNKKDNHHVNDVYVEGDTLFVSMFSFSGNWMNEVYDGGIMEMDRRTGENRNIVVSGLWMPHSVNRFNGKLCYVDSMRGEFFDTTWTPVGKVSAFIRGLDFDGKYYYVGASEHSYPEKLFGQSSNISLDAGFYVFEPETKMSRFFKLLTTTTVHSLLVMKQ
jgi:hypothetical protein